MPDSDRSGSCPSHVVGLVLVPGRVITSAVGLRGRHLLAFVVLWIEELSVAHVLSHGALLVEETRNIEDAKEYDEYERRIVPVA